MDNIHWDVLLKRIRDILNSEKISLWLPPYTKENAERGEDELNKLVERFCQKLQAPKENVVNAIEELRVHSLMRLAERDKFRSEGIATLRVKVTCSVPRESASRKPISVECGLSISGLDLKELIASKSDASADLLRLICKGKVMEDNKTLEAQGVKHGSDIMAMCLSASEATLNRKEAEIVEVEKTRKAAELLSSCADDDEDFDVQIADQNGQPLTLPMEEKKALTLAMTLHEKGRSALKDKRISQALLLLIESDSEFRKCSSGILSSVDNYAILCLDIVWCYLLLKNLDQLPDAEKRLTTSEDCFKRSYGEKMERLTAIKGGTGTEQALFMRLYLLQGIVAFHKGDSRDAQNLFRRAEFVLNLLHVDEEKINEVMAMGFTSKEARLGLRAKNGNVQRAVDYIIQTRKDFEENSDKAKKEWQQRVRGKNFGKTIDGQHINVESFDRLVAMEFPKGAVAEALRRSNNDISLAIEVLQNHPEIFNLPDPEKKSRIKITDEMIQQVVGLGFEMETVRRVLQSFHGNIQRAVEQLISNSGALPASSLISPSPSSSFSSASEVSAGDSSPSDSSTESPSPTDGKRRKRSEDKKKELESLVSDIDLEVDNHLDLTLSEEREILNTYQVMASTMPQVEL